MPIRWFSPSLALAALCLLLALTVASAASLPTELTPPFSVQWIFSMGDDPTNTTTPLVQGDRVYVTHLGVLHCLDAQTGAEQWKLSIQPAAIVTSPVPWEDLIIVGGTNASLYALDARTGRQVWERTCAGAISPDPLVFDNTLMVGAETLVYAITPRTGAPTWVCSLTSAAKAGPVTDGSMLYFLCQDNSVQCVDAEAGRYRWTRNFPAGARTFDPIVGYRRVIVATGDMVHGIARSSTVAWTAQMPAGVAAAPTLAEETLYVPAVDGRIYTLYGRSGAPRHEVTLKLDDPVTAPPLVTNTLIAAGTATSLLCTLNRDTGQVQWVYRCRAPEQSAGDASDFGIYAPVVAADGSLYCLTGTGDLYRFSPSAPDSDGPSFTEFKPAPGSALPGGQSLTIGCAVLDPGSGVVASSIAGTLDGRPVKTTFEAASGLAALLPGPLRDGPHVVKVTARDYRGNISNAEWSFVTDASLAPPPEERPGRRTLGASTTRRPTAR